MTKEHPIIFSGPMVKAIMEVRKTQTRRVIKPQPLIAGEFIENGIFTYGNHGDELDTFIICPYGQPGDRLWVRETFMEHHGESKVWYKASQSEQSLALLAGLGGKWRPSIHMPRWASRITLEVVGIRVEHIQDISEDDAMAEGIEHNWLGPIEECPEEYLNEWRNYLDNDDDGFPCFSAKESFVTLWQSINGKRPGCLWNDNPYVWVVEFKVVK